MEQKGAGDKDVVVTDGLELQEVFKQRNDPTEATLNDKNEYSDLQTGLDSATQEDRSLKNGDVTSLEDIDGRQTSEDETSLETEGPSRDNRRRLTSESDRESKKRLDIRTNRKYELKERLNIDSERSKDQRHITRDSVVKAGQKKSLQSPKHGNTAEFEASIGSQTPSVPDSNFSASTPPPYILKVKNTTGRKAELDDIYFLCE